MDRNGRNYSFVSWLSWKTVFIPVFFLKIAEIAEEIRHWKEEIR